MATLEQVLDAFRTHGLRTLRASWGYSCQCPVHHDSTPSISLRVGGTGNILIYCHAGCETREVVSALGLRMADLMSGDKPTEAVSATVYPTAKEAIAVATRGLEVTGRWVYHDACMNPLMVVVRCATEGGKTFRQVSRCPEGWVCRAIRDNRPIYRMPDIVFSDGPVVVVEGEKCADALWTVGITGTTSSGGASAVEKTDWSPLNGRTVLVLPDNDQPGDKYAASVAREVWLAGAAEVRIIRLSDRWSMEKGDDIADLIERGVSVTGLI